MIQKLSSNAKSRRQERRIRQLQLENKKMKQFLNCALDHLDAVFDVNCTIVQYKAAVLQELQAKIKQFISSSP